MTRNEYRKHWQRRHRWRGQVETALARIETLLAKRPPGKEGELPDVPRPILTAWRLRK